MANPSAEKTATPPWRSWETRAVAAEAKAAAPAARPPWRMLVGALVVLLAVFGWPLVELFRYAYRSGLYSYIVLMPFVTAYLVWHKRRELAASRWSRSKFWLVFAALAAVLLGGYGVACSRGWQPSDNDSLSVVTLAFVCSLVAVCLYTGGAAVTRLLAFPLGMLAVFLPPAPDAVVNGINLFLQHASAEVAYVFLLLSGTPVLREGLVFQLGSIVMKVAEECSGIRSSLVLVITSLFAGYWFLRTPWKRAVLALVVIPLGVVRNAFRIFTLAMLCEHIDPAMIDSAIHKRGGPLFFALSLVPLFLLLWWLRRTDRPKVRAGGGDS